MRMKRPSLARDERGVAAVMVAIALVAIIGMLALAVDLGFMEAKRRGMVGANDAAALAFAESCALKRGLTDAEDQAVALATANVSDAAEAEPYQMTGDCDGSGSVTVHYKGQQNLFFAPIVGFDSSVTASATATAVWGPAGGAGNVIPLMLSMGRLTNCDIPDAPIDTVCHFYVDNRPAGIGDAQWGLLNVQPDPSDPKFGWDVEDVNYQCPSFSESELRFIINNGSPDSLGIDYPDPTYVCRVPGAGTPAFRDVELLEGQARVFPVNDPNGQILRGGAPAPPPITPDFYDIVGFAQLLIENVMRGTDSDWDPNCPGAQNSNAWCLKVVWKGYSTSPAPVCPNCQYFGVGAAQLTG
jgi:Flp pilus assembly protein TadG